MLRGEPAFPQRLLNLPKYLPQILERAGLVSLGPEQGAERLARVVTWFDGKKSQQSQRFTALQHDEFVIEVDLCGTHKVQRKTRGHASPFYLAGEVIISGKFARPGSLWILRRFPRRG